MAFSSLSEKFKHIFAKLTRSGKLTDLEIKAAMREIKLVLLEADVNIAVVKNFIAQTTEKCSGETVMQSLTPGQQIIKIVHEEMTELLGGDNAKLAVASNPPTVIMMCGLQGAGKTTFTRGLAEGMGLPDVVSSPTFALVNEYHAAGCTPMYHFDMYRVTSAEALETTGFWDYPLEDGVFVIEWAENIADVLAELPARFLRISITGSGDAPRTITIEGDESLAASVC